MITTITFGPAPPGKYSLGSLSAKPEHPAAPSRDTPAAPAPAAFKKSLRVSALSAVLRTVKERTVPRKHACFAGLSARRFAPFSTPPCGRLVSSLSRRPRPATLDEPLPEE